MNFDWSRYAVGGAASRADSFSKLNPDYASRVAQLVQAADADLGPGALKITSAYRSNDLQAKLYQSAIKKYGSEKAARKWVAPPGRSKHNTGMAVDFADAGGNLLRDANSREARWIKANASRFGLDVPMEWEPWQVELAGSRGGSTSGGPVQGGGGSDAVAGGGADDALVDLDAWFSQVDAPAAAVEPEPEPFTLPDATVADDYAATGALDLSDLDAWFNAPSSGATAASGVDAATGLPIAARPPRADAPIEAMPPQPSDIRGQLSAPGFEAAGQFAQASQQGPAAFLPNIAGAALTGLSGAIGYGVGGAADLAVAAGANPNSMGRLARDVMAMPDAFAGSPQQAGRVATAPKLPGQPAAGRIEPAVTRPVQAPNMQDVASLLAKAQGRGKTSRQAMRELARLAKVDPEALAAAERMGIDLPVDVFSEAVDVQKLAGSIRGVRDSAASADFWQGIKAAQGRADEIMSQIDGGQSIADVSENVMSSLRATQSTLKSGATEMYQSVDKKIPKSTPVKADKTTSILSQTMEDLGGMSRMTAQEKTLFHALTNSDEPLTYGGMVRLKQDIWRAIGSGQGPYADVNKATLERLYGGLADDQLAAVEAVGGADLRKVLEGANSLTAQRKELEKSIVSAFGKDLEGSVASKLRAAVTQGARGDISGLNRILNVIPVDLRREAVASAISNIATTSRGSEPGQFSFEAFTKVYQGLRANPPVYAKVVGVLGEEGHAMMGDLYRVSAAVSRAKAAIPTTGASNQILMNGALTADGLIARVMNTTAGRTAVRASTTGVMGTTMGVGAAIAADSIGAALTKAKPNRLQAAGKLLASDQFKAMAIEAATKPEVSASARRGVLNSPAFRQFAKATGIESPEAWLNAAILGNISAQAEKGEQ